MADGYGRLYVDKWIINSDIYLQDQGLTIIQGFDDLRGWPTHPLEKEYSPDQH